MARRQDIFGIKRLSQIVSFKEEKSYLAYIFEKSSQLKLDCLKGNDFVGTGGFFIFI